MAGFLLELDEHVRTLNDELLALEKGVSQAEVRPRVDALFRAAHTLKSAARAVGFSQIEAASHRVEGVMSAVRAGTLPLSQGLFETLFAAVDRFQEAGREAKTGSGLPATYFDDIARRLDEVSSAARTGAGERGRATGSSAGVVASPPPGGRALEPASRAGAALESPPPVEGSKMATPGEPRSETLETGGDRATPAGRTPEMPGGEPPGGGMSMLRVGAEQLDDILTLSRELGQKAARLSSDVLELDQLQSTADALDRELRLGRGATTNRPTTSGKRRSAVRRKQIENAQNLRAGLSRVRAALRADLGVTERLLDQLDGELQQLRMLPFQLACQGLDRTVRDLGRETGRQVELHLSGGEVEMDRAVLDALRDPLRHLVRNSIGHGIEPASERAAAGKPVRGTVRVSAALQRGQVEVSVEDDGRGIDLQAVKIAARRSGLESGEDAESLLRLLLLPGFSTAAEATALSGRGVGLDVVRTQVEKMQGTVRLSTTPGRGTVVTMTVPLTLTTVSALLVVDQSVFYALPDSHVSRVIRVAPEDIQVSAGRSLLLLEGRPIPVAPLSRLLDGAPGEPRGPGERVPGVVLSVQEREAILLVDRLVETRDILVRPLSPRLGRVRHLSGAALLPDGRVALILYPPGLVDVITGSSPDGAWLRREDRAEARAARRLLLVDDSLTTRSLEKMILESAGYEILVASDGMEAWEILQRTPVDLVVSDVQMPRMDGFGLTSAIRGFARLSELPVVLVTGLDSEEDRTRGLEAGADAYIVKGAFDQGVLLETIERLL